MGFLDRLMDTLTKRGTKLVGSGHPPADTEPETGSDRLSAELQADYGADATASLPPPHPADAAAPCRQRLIAVATIRHAGLAHAQITLAGR